MKKWYVAAIGILLLALGGVIYGVLTHKEAGLLRVCWHKGVAEYRVDCPHELQWKKQYLPLPVYINFDAETRVYTESVKAAMRMWNKEIGPVFAHTVDVAGARVTVSWGSQNEVGNANALGHTKHRAIDSTPVFADVILLNPSDLHNVMRVVMHELGHVLGLADDADAKRSIMYKELEDVTDDLRIALPSDFDRKLLKRLYF